MHLFGAAWTPEQWALIIPILGLQIVGIITALRHGDKVTKSAETAVQASEKATEQVEAVHHELRPPSNGTTAGAYIETSNAQWLWVYEELRHIGRALGIEQHEPPPELPKVDTPSRPGDRRRDRHP